MENKKMTVALTRGFIVKYNLQIKAKEGELCGKHSRDIGSMVYKNQRN